MQRLPVERAKGLGWARPIIVSGKYLERPRQHLCLKRCLALHFTVEVKPPWKVLVAAAPPAIERSLSLTEALAPDAWRKTGQEVGDVLLNHTCSLAAVLKH